jgi:hypothetical protein
MRIFVNEEYGYRLWVWEPNAITPDDLMTIFREEVIPTVYDPETHQDLLIQNPSEQITGIWTPIDLDAPTFSPCPPSYYAHGSKHVVVVAGPFDGEMQIHKGIDTVIHFDTDTHMHTYYAQGSKPVVFEKTPKPSTD